MGKGDRKAAARRAKRKWRGVVEGLPELAPVPRREADGRVRRADREDWDRDAAQVALRARCRMMGWPEDDTRAQAHSLEGQAGRAIHLGSRDEREVKRLWGVFVALDAAEEAYFRRIIGRRRHAAVAKLEMMPDRMEVRSDDRPDYRTTEEKDRDAVNAWMRWRGFLGHLRGDEQTAIHDALLHRRDLTAGHALTTSGQAFVAAMRVLANVVER